MEVDGTMNPYLDEYERMSRLLGLYQGPAHKFIQDVERYRELTEQQPGYRALRELQDSVASEARRTQEMLTSAFSGVLGQYKLLQSVRPNFGYPERLAAEVHQALAAFRAPAFPVIESLLDSVKYASRSVDLLKQFELTFGGQLLEHAQAVAEASDEDFGERIDELTSLLKTHIEQSKTGPVSLEGYIQIILAIAFFIQSFVNAHKSEVASRKHFQDIEAQLKQLTTIEKVERTPDLRRVSAKVLRVRDEPNAKSQLRGRITLNALVRVLREENSWANIEYFDFVEGRSREGWVAKRFLRVLPEERDAFVEEASRRVLENSEW